MTEDAPESVKKKKMKFYLYMPQLRQWLRNFLLRSGILIFFLFPRFQIKKTGFFLCSEIKQKQ
jgi:hypothetical protein